MSEDIFFNNIKRRMIDIAVQVKHSSQKGISNQAKSGYFRFAILLACTIVEGLLYNIVKKYLAESNESMGATVAYKYPYTIPSRYLNNKTVLCIQEKKDIPLSNQTKFNELILFSKKKEIIKEKEKKQLEKIMRLRNKIHVQSLNESDNGYTKKKLDDIFSVINLLFIKSDDMIDWLFRK